MYAPHGLRPTPVTWLVIVYLALQAVAWATGAWGRIPVFAVEAAVVPAGGGRSGSRHAGAAESAATSGEETAMVPRPGLGLSGRKDPGVRATLAAMALLMAYMLLAMV